MASSRPGLSATRGGARAPDPQPQCRRAPALRSLDVTARHPATWRVRSSTPRTSTALEPSSTAGSPIASPAASASALPLRGIHNRRRCGQRRNPAPVFLPDASDCQRYRRGARRDVAAAHFEALYSFGRRDASTSPYGAGPAFFRVRQTIVDDLSFAMRIRTMHRRSSAASTQRISGHKAGVQRERGYCDAHLASVGLGADGARVERRRAVRHVTNRHDDANHKPAACTARSLRLS